MYVTIWQRAGHTNRERIGHRLSHKPLARPCNKTQLLRTARVYKLIVNPGWTPIWTSGSFLWSTIVTLIANVETLDEASGRGRHLLRFVRLTAESPQSEMDLNSTDISLFGLGTPDRSRTGWQCGAARRKLANQAGKRLRNYR